MEETEKLDQREIRGIQSTDTFKRRPDAGLRAVAGEANTDRCAVCGR